MDDGALYPNDGALNQSVWQTNPRLAFISAMRGRGLFGAMAAKEQAELDRQRSEQKNQQTQKILTSMPQDAIASPADLFRHRASLFAQAGRLDEAGKLADLAKKLDKELEFKDGVWYNKKTGEPVRGGAFVNQQGFGGTMNVGPQGQISAAQLPGAAELYAQQQGIGEGTRAQFDLQQRPSTGPNVPPQFASRLDLLRGGPAGMSPNQQAQVAADQAQQVEVSKNYANIYNSLQNASMQNPAKIAKFQQIGNLLGDFEGGKFSGAGLELSRAANSAGLKIDSKLPNKEAAIAMSNEIALELRSPAGGAGMPGALSDKDREFLTSMTPQMSQTAEGRKSIINARVKVMERENKVAQMSRQYRQKYGKLDENFFSQLQEWSNRNPVFKLD